MVLISILMMYLSLYQIFNTLFRYFVYLCISNNSKIILLGQSNF